MGTHHCIGQLTGGKRRYDWASLCTTSTKLCNLTPVHTELLCLTIIARTFAVTAQVVEVLLNRGADIEAEDPDGYNPLALATCSGHEEVACWCSLCREVNKRFDEHLHHADCVHANVSLCVFSFACTRALFCMQHRSSCRSASKSKLGCPVIKILEDPALVQWALSLKKYIDCR